MSFDTLLYKGKLLLEKFEGKGGWTYIRLPDTTAASASAFGWKKVSGTMDGHELKACSTMPMGKGRLFVPIRAEIRKAIGKQVGDEVEVALYTDARMLHSPEEFIECLGDEPQALAHFRSFPQAEQKRYLDWIAAANNEEVQIERMIAAIDRLAKGFKMKQP